MKEKSKDETIIDEIERELEDELGIERIIPDPPIPPPMKSCPEGTIPKKPIPPKNIVSREGKKPFIKCEFKLNKLSNGKLRLNKSNKAIGGVVSGILRYFDIEDEGIVFLTRALLTIAFFVGLGSLLPLYLVAWFIIPNEVGNSEIEDMFK